jgi:fructose-1-phosphate kinase PfkB-like protein|tara:strand:+ start:244 stop:396 length:153 start_codon:yes stop_codon:yes gene_type:complete
MAGKEIRINVRIKREGNAVKINGKIVNVTRNQLNNLMKLSTKAKRKKRRK